MVPAVGGRAALHHLGFGREEPDSGAQRPGGRPPDGARPAPFEGPGTDQDALQTVDGILQHIDQDVVHTKGSRTLRLVCHGLPGPNDAIVGKPLREGGWELEVCQTANATACWTSERLRRAMPPP